MTYLKCFFFLGIARTIFSLCVEGIAWQRPAENKAEEPGHGAPGFGSFLF